MKPHHSPAKARTRSSRAVFLVGFMGAGKTSVGQELCDRLGWHFVDLDDRIEAASGKSISELFQSEGEPRFRELESEALRRVVEEIAEPTVVALGGGAFAQPANIDVLENAAAQVIFLDAPLDELRRRIGEDDRRPLFADAERFRQLYDERQPHYRRAGCRIQTDGKSVAEVAREIEFLVKDR